MRFLLIIIILLCCASLHAAGFPALVYHDIQPSPVTETFTVSLQSFEKQMRYLKKKGYQPISLRTLHKAWHGQATLPKKPVLLTFDDGLVSYKRYALPILEKYKFPSVLSVVTSWTNGKKAPKAYYGKVLAWSDIRKLDKHPLVEVVSHSHALHTGVLSNPQGNKKALAIARIYNPRTRRYEKEQHFRSRIKRDILVSTSRFKRHLGHGPVAITWPFGHYEQWHIDKASRQGVQFHLTLDEGPVYLKDLPRINRYLMYNKNRKESFGDILNLREHHYKQVRFIEIDLSAFASSSVKQQETLLSGLIQRIELLGINTIVINPFSKDEKSAYFTNNILSVKTNILDRVLHQIDARNQIGIILRVPVSVPISVIRDLARLHYFHGVILYGDKKTSSIKKILRIFKYHRPPLQVGIEGPLDIKHDFRYIRITSASDIPNIIKKDIYVALPKNKNLIKQLRQIRKKGIRNLGYALDDYRSNNPDVLQVAPEIRKRSHVSMRKRQ